MSTWRLARLVLRPLARIVRPAFEALLSLIPVDDAWERLQLQAPPHAFGPGSRHDFRWYLEGESRVAVRSVDEVCAWLLECEYAGDPELFNERDFWQHPRTFEHLRRGDCEDHALWAWRKLVELRVDAEFVAGRWDVTRADAAGHAWVLFRDAGHEYVLETVSHTRVEMVQPLSAVRARYEPHFAINGQFETTAFGGYLLSLKRHRAERRGKRKAGSDGRAAQRH